MGCSVYIERLRKYTDDEIKKMRGKYTDEIPGFGSNIEIPQVKYKQLTQQSIKGKLRRLNVIEILTDFDGITKYVHEAYGDEAPIRYNVCSGKYYTVDKMGKCFDLPIDRFQHETERVYYVCASEPLNCDIEKYEARKIRDFLQRLLGVDDVAYVPVNLNEEQRAAFIKFLAEEYEKEDGYIFNESDILKLIYNLILYPDDIFLEVQD